METNLIYDTKLKKLRKLDYYLSTSEIDMLLVNLAASANSNIETIDLTQHAPRSTSSNAAMITLQGKNKTILVNEYLGTEIILNGGFTPSTGWTADNGGTVNTGKGVLNGVSAITQETGTNGYIFRDRAYVNYRLEYTILAKNDNYALYNAGYGRLYPSTIGRHSLIINNSAINLNSISFIIDQAGHTCEIDDISLKTVGNKKITVLGDSISTNYGFPLTGTSNKPWILLMLQSGYVVSDYAVAGAPIVPVQGYVDMAQQVALAANDNAETILVAMGTNDLNDGNMTTLKSIYKANMQVLQLQNPRTTIYAMNVLPRWSNTGTADTPPKDNIRTAIAEVCTELGIECWDTYTVPWITYSDTSDGTHPNNTGAAKIKAKVAELLPI